MMHQKLTRACALALLMTMLAVTPAFALFGRSSDEKNQTAEEGAPTAQAITISTYRDVPYTAQFLAEDQEGGELTFSLVTQPKHGTVAIEGDSFTYTPAAGKTGKDSFTYAATDAEGHVSAPALVDVTVAKAKTAVTYSDMEGNTACAAAIRLAEAGVFVGSQVGDEYFFEPDRTVSRGEFLAMTMETAGLDAAEATMTGFADDAAIPTWAKSYASSALKNGLVKGVSTADGVAFEAGAPITMNEAAVVLDRVLSVGDVDLETWYADRESVPSWAAQAVGNMESVSVLKTGSFGSSAMNQTVTRADAAQMLAAAGTLLEGEKTGLMSWLS